MEGDSAAAVKGHPVVAVTIDGRTVQIGLRTAEIIRQLVAHQGELDSGQLPHGDVNFRLQQDRVKMAVTRVLPARRVAE